MDEPREQTAVLNCFLKLPTILFPILTNHGLVACVPQRSNDMVDMVRPDFNTHSNFGFSCSWYVVTDGQLCHQVVHS